MEDGSTGDGDPDSAREGTPGLTLRPGSRSGGWQVGAGLEMQGEVPQAAAVTPSPLLSSICTSILTSHTPLSLRLSSGVSPREGGEPLVACGLRCLGWAGSGAGGMACQPPASSTLSLLAPPGAAI